MTVSLGKNIASLGITRQLSKTSRDLQSAFARLGSGQRINKGSDDPAGLALSESLNASTRLAQVAIRNANDGISAISIADGALAEVGSILARQAELANQAANGIYSTAQRSVLQSEFIALGSEVERIATSTEFNGIRLLSGTQAIVLQVGIETSSLSQLTLNGVQGTLQALGLAGTGSSALTYSINDTSDAFAQSSARLALSAINAAIASLSASRGSLGAVESRLQVTVNNLSVVRENLWAAVSRIKDIDVAEEPANYTRLAILQQVGVSMLAQSNQTPQLALQLLK